MNEQRPRRAAGWRSIDTIPQDGSLVIVWNPEWQLPEFCYWRAKDGTWCVAPPFGGMRVTKSLSSTYRWWRRLSPPAEVRLDLVA
jgi:hypothetical protein